MDPQQAMVMTGPPAMVEQLALFFERFGFRANLGRIWATLYLNGEPLTQQELGERLGISAGLVSSALKELEHWEMVKPVNLPGARRTHYRTEERLLRIVSAILLRRELVAVRDLREAVTRAREEAGSQPRQVAALAASSERLAAIEEAVELYLAMANLVAATARLPAPAVRLAIRLVKNLRLGTAHAAPLS